jgi:pimeloyl-ACP methyl ester carboxylesterase
MLISTVLFLTSVLAVLPDRPRLDPANLGTPFQRYTTKDALGRTITFYLSVLRKDRPQPKRPVALFVAGSGCQSLFRKRGELVMGGHQLLLLAEAKERVRVLVVEKLGVQFLDAPPTPGTARGATKEFLTEHTLGRWAEANIAAVRAAWTLPDIDPARTLVAGHSEGGMVAARVAAELPGVTHVASLSGGGPTQLFDFVSNAGQPRPDDKPGDAARRIQAVYEGWAKVQADPASITEFWMGHPNRRWSSFLKSSVTGELLRSRARVYLAHGLRDTIIPVASHDAAVAELRAHGRDVTAERVEDADHGFQPKDAPPGPPEGMQDLFGRVLTWFLG